MSFLYKVSVHYQKMNTIRKFYIHSAALLCALCSISSNVAYAEETLLVFSQTLQKIDAYQQPEKWNNQEKIANLEVEKSKVWDNPTLSIQQTGFNRRQEKSSEIVVAQQIDIFGTKRKAAYVSKIQKQNVILNKEMYQIQQFLAVKYFWMQILFLEKEVAILKQQFEVSELSLHTAQLRLQAGSIAKIDFERVEVSTLDLDSQYKQQTAALEILKNKFSKLWGSTASNFHLNEMSEQAWQQQAESMPLKINIYESAVQLQKQSFEAQLDYLKAQAKPKPSVTLGVVRTQSEFGGKSDQQVRVGLDIPLNIFNREQYSQKIEETKLKLVEQERLRYQRQQIIDIQNLSAEIKLLKEKLNTLTHSQIPLSKSIQQKMLLGFKAGKYAVTDIQLSTLELQQRQLQEIELNRNIFQKTMQLDCLRFGIEPESILYTDAINNLNKSLRLGMENE